MNMHNNGNVFKIPSQKPLELLKAGCRGVNNLVSTKSAKPHWLELNCYISKN